MQKNGMKCTTAKTTALMKAVLGAVLVMTACAVAIAPAGAPTSFADSLAATSVARFPDVTDDMAKPSYWSDKQKDPDSVQIDRATIDQLNEAGIKGDGTGLQPLKTASGTYYDKDGKAALKAGAESDIQGFIGKTWDESGKVLTKADADAIIANYPDPDDTTPSIASPYAIVTKHTTMRCFPTDRMLGYTQGDKDDDNLYLSMLRVNEPLIIRAQSHDGKYFLCISSFLNAAWVPADYIAICADKDEWLDAWDIPKGKELVVTGYKVRTEQSRMTPNTVNRLLYMGTVLESVDWDDASKLVGTRSVYNNHVCYLPVRNENGTYAKEVALIAESAQVSEGYLPLTKANVAKVAFNSLGQMYGWGGMLEANDCSGYVRDVYKCFGLELPRNTSGQPNFPVRKYDLAGLDDKHKAAAIAQMPLGTVLFWDGHEMIYLGKDNGKLYVVSALGSIGNLFGTGGTAQVKSVAMNTLDMIRGDRSTWLQNLTIANVPYIPASAEGTSLYDIAFYEDSISWPSASYVYTGAPIAPDVSVAGLDKGTDYEVSYQDNVNVGTATVTVSGKGILSGSVSKTFSIEKAPQSIVAKKKVTKKVKASSRTKTLSKRKTVSLKKLAKVSAMTAVTYKKVNKAGGKKIVVNAKTGKVTLKKGLKKGTYKVKVRLTAPADASYTAAKALTVTLKVAVRG